MGENLPNKLHIVRKRGKFPGEELKDVEGFDYEDEKTGLRLSVRDGDSEVGLFGKRISVESLHAFVRKAGD